MWQIDIVYDFIFVYLFIYSFIYLFIIYLFIYSFIQSLNYLCIINLSRTFNLLEFGRIIYSWVIEMIYYMANECLYMPSMWSFRH